MHVSFNLSFRRKNEKKKLWSKEKCRFFSFFFLFPFSAVLHCENKNLKLISFPVILFFCSFNSIQTVAFFIKKSSNSLKNVTCVKIVNIRDLATWIEDRTTKMISRYIFDHFNVRIESVREICALEIPARICMIDSMHSINFYNPK